MCRVFGWTILGLVVASLGWGCAGTGSHESESDIPAGLTTCVVSGEPLDAMGEEPVVMNYKGRKIPLCCRQCIKDFNKEPEKYAAKFDAELKKIQAQKSSPDQK